MVEKMAIETVSGGQDEDDGDYGWRWWMMMIIDGDGSGQDGGRQRHNFVDQIV